MPCSQVRVLADRWLEYSASASVMAMGIAISVGLREQNVLSGIFMLHFATMVRQIPLDSHPLPVLIRHSIVAVLRLLSGIRLDAEVRRRHQHLLRPRRARRVCRLPPLGRGAQVPGGVPPEPLARRAGAARRDGRLQRQGRVQGRLPARAQRAQDHLAGRVGGELAPARALPDRIRASECSSRSSCVRRATARPPTSARTTPLPTGPSTAAAGLSTHSAAPTMFGERPPCILLPHRRSDRPSCWCSRVPF